MAKGLTVMSLVIAILLFSLFALDLAIGLPFRKASILMDIAFVICSLILGLISLGTLRELK
jgi:hypothetical protein